MNSGPEFNKPQKDVADPEIEVENKERKVTRILLAEDNESLREALRATLEGRGYEVEAVENGTILLEKISSRDFDVVMTDFNMPPDEMTGLEVLKKIRGDEKTKTLPVIVLTARDEKTIKENVEKLGGLLLNKTDEKSTQNILDAIKKIV